MRSLLATVGVVVVAAAVAAAEEGTAEIPVGDLVRAPEPRMARMVTGRVPDSYMEPDDASRRIAGEQSLLDGSVWVRDEDGNVVRRPPGSDPLALSPDTLEVLLLAIVGRDGREMRVDPASGVLRVPPDAVPGATRALERVRAAKPPWVDVAVTLEEVPASGPPVTVFSGRGSVPAGRSVAWADARDTLVLLDYEVEIAQASWIANPRTATWTTGHGVLLRAHPLPGSGVAVVEVVARVAEPRDPETIDLGHPGFGRLDRCAVGIDEAGVGFLARSGETTEHVWTGRDGRTLRLRVTPRFATPPTSPDGPGIVWSPLLGQPLVGFTIETNARPDHDAMPESEPFFLEPGRRVAGWPTADERLGAAGVALFDGEDGRRAPDALDAFVRSAAEGLSGARVEVRAFEVAAGLDVPPDGPPPAGSALRARFAGPVLHDLPACAGGTHERMYVRDWDVEVAQAVRVPDPQVARVCDGHGIGLRVSRDASGARVAHLDVLLERLERIDRQTMPLDVAASSSGVHGNVAEAGGNASGSTDTVPAYPQDVVAVEKPIVRRLRVLADLPLGPDGRGVVRRSATTFAGPGREIVVLVEVR